jgi:hypothetical protein
MAYDSRCLDLAQFFLEGRVPPEVLNAMAADLAQAIQDTVEDFAAGSAAAHVKREIAMANVVEFPKLEMALIPVDDLPPGTRYKCEAPDWIARKTTDNGMTWTEIGRLDPTRNKMVPSTDQR